ncbi:expressed unknown protein [Seminavis robusta]|uniref:Uncharacterized protein n=1 Tax=Seminavis robusta TaxID=568900 RepID=A0A9N8HRJ4_9STRA|nr:expressed unknown protein [Seminavis robusta]|eukprot:Sro1405_g269780.1 n/a (224) ;mRNA; f:3163-3834
MTMLSITTATSKPLNNNSKTSKIECPATMALTSLIGIKRDATSLMLPLVGDQASHSTLSDGVDFPSIEWLHDDDQAAATQQDAMTRGVNQCLQEAFRLAQSFDTCTTVSIEPTDRPKKRRRLGSNTTTGMLRSNAVPCSLASLAAASKSDSDELFPSTLKPLLPLSLPTTHEKLSPLAHEKLLPALLFRDSTSILTLKECPFPKSFKSASRTLSLNCRVSPLA